MVVDFQSKGSCPAWLVLDPTAVGDVLLVSRGFVLDRWPEYEMELTKLCQEGRLVKVDSKFATRARIFINEPVPSSVHRVAEIAHLKEAFVVFPSGELFIGSADRVPIARASRDVQHASVRPGIYAVELIAFDVDEIDRQVSTGMGDKLSRVERAQVRTAGLGCLGTLLTLVLWFLIALGLRYAWAIQVGLFALGATAIALVSTYLLNRSSIGKEARFERRRIEAEWPHFIIHLERTGRKVLPKPFLAPLHAEKQKSDPDLKIENDNALA